MRRHETGIEAKGTEASVGSPNVWPSGCVLLVVRLCFRVESSNICRGKYDRVPIRILSIYGVLYYLLRLPKRVAAWYLGSNVRKGIDYTFRIDVGLSCFVVWGRTRGSDATYTVGATQISAATYSGGGVFRQPCIPEAMYTGSHVHSQHSRSVGTQLLGKCNCIAKHRRNNVAMLPAGRYYHHREFVGQPDPRIGSN